MPSIGWSEMLLIVVVLLLVVGPKELPRMLRTVSRYVRQARKLANEFRSTLEAAVYDDEVKDIQEELKQQSAQLNRSFTEAHPEVAGNRIGASAKGTHNPATLSPPVNPKAAGAAPMPEIDSDGGGVNVKGDSKTAAVAGNEGDTVIVSNDDNNGDAVNVKGDSNTAAVTGNKGNDNNGAVNVNADAVKVKGDNNGGGVNVNVNDDNNGGAVNVNVNQAPST